MLFVALGYACFVLPGLVLHIICILNAATYSEVEDSTDSTPQIVVTGVVQDQRLTTQLPSLDFATALAKAFELKKRGLISVFEFDDTKRSLIDQFCALGSKPAKHDTLLALVPLIDSGALNKDDVERIKSSYDYAA